MICENCKQEYIRTSNNQKYCKKCKKGYYMKIWKENNLEKYKESRKEARKKWRKNNPEKLKESWKRYRENNPEKCKNGQKKWKENNPEKHKESKKKSDKKYRENNKDKIKKKQTEWRRKNPEKICEEHKRHRQKHPEKCRARYILNERIRDGKFPRVSDFNCVKCNVVGEHFHHLDYGKPLLVIPVCEVCHKEIHSREDET